MGYTSVEYARLRPLVMGCLINIASEIKMSIKDAKQIPRLSIFFKLSIQIFSYSLTFSDETSQRNSNFDKILFRPWLDSLTGSKRNQ